MVWPNGLLPLGDCLYALQPSIPHLTRSALHRCLQRHGISRLPDIDGDKPKRQRFKRYPIGVRAFSRTNGVHALTPHRMSHRGAIGSSPMANAEVQTAEV